MRPTEDNIIVGFEGVDFCSTPDDETKQQILENQEKAENYDSIIEYVGNHKGLFSHNVKDWIEKLEQENKQLKSDTKNMERVIDEWKDNSYKWQQRAVYAEQKLEKYQDKYGVLL